MTAADFFSARQVCGRANYVCLHCRREIPRGIEHVRVSSSSSGVLSGHRAHLDCHSAAIGAQLSPKATAARSA